MEKLKVTLIGKYFGQEISFFISVKSSEATRLLRGDYYAPADIEYTFLSPSQKKTLQC